MNAEKSDRWQIFLLELAREKQPPALPEDRGSLTTKQGNNNKIWKYFSTVIQPTQKNQTVDSSILLESARENQSPVLPEECGS